MKWTACALLLLLALPAQETPRDRAAALNDRALAAMKDGHLDEAIRDLEEACRIEEKEPVLRANLASVLCRRCDRSRDAFQLREALADAERALGLDAVEPGIVARVAELRLKLQGVQSARATLRVAPSVAKEPVVLLASARISYEEDALDEAVQELERALELDTALALRPRDALLRLLERWRREAEVERFAFRHVAGAFSVKVPSKEWSTRGESVLREVQRIAAGLEASFGPRPERVLYVVLLDEAGWKKLERGPEWSGGVFDGRVRIPLQHVERVDANLSRTLTHEMVHWFVRSLAPECPLWLNEGLAQHHECGSGPSAAETAELKQGTWRSLSTLPGEWMKLGSAEAAGLYRASHAFTSWLVEREGMPKVLGWLQAIGKGAADEDPFAATFGRTLAEAEVAFLAELR